MPWEINYMQSHRGSQSHLTTKAAHALTPLSRSSSTDNNLQNMIWIQDCLTTFNKKIRNFSSALSFIYKCHFPASKQILCQKTFPCLPGLLQPINRVKPKEDLRETVGRVEVLKITLVSYPSLLLFIYRDIFRKPFT